MKKFAMWSIAHSLHWAVLYGAFFASVDGAMYVLKFMVWTMAPLSVLLLVGQVAADVAKNPPTPVRNWMSMLQAWVTLGLLVWFGHIASALAWGLVMLVIALHREATKKARSAATSAALDRGAGPRSKLAAGRETLRDMDAKLGRLTDAMLDSAEDGVPAAFAKRAREIEAEKARLQAELAGAERELAATARVDLVGADAIWRSLAHGVEHLDYAARLQTRQLVADTFERIVVWRRGIRPAETPAGTMDVLLLAKGGAGRMLRIDRDGNWLAAEDLAA